MTGASKPFEKIQLPSWMKIHIFIRHLLVKWSSFLYKTLILKSTSLLPSKRWTF